MHSPPLLVVQLKMKWGWRGQAKAVARAKAKAKVQVTVQVNTKGILKETQRESLRKCKGNP